MQSILQYRGQHAGVGTAVQVCNAAHVTAEHLYASDSIRQDRVQHATLLCPFNCDEKTKTDMQELVEKAKDKGIFIQIFLFADDSNESQVREDWMQQPAVPVVMPLLCKEFVASPHACLLLQLVQANPEVRILPVVANFKSFNAALDLTDDFFKAEFPWAEHRHLESFRVVKKLSSWNSSSPGHMSSGQRRHSESVRTAHAKRRVQDLKRCMPYIKSVLNRANRVPSSSDFDTKIHLEVTLLPDMPLSYPTCQGSADLLRSMQVLNEALRTILLADSSEETRLRIRAGKYNMSCLPNTLPTVPRTGGSFAEKYTENMNALNQLLKKEFGEKELAIVLVCCSGCKGALELCDQIVDSLTFGTRHQVYCGMQEDHVPWFEKCVEADVCIVVLSEAFVRDAACESMVTFAKDSRKHIIRVMGCRESWNCVMASQVGR